MQESKDCYWVPTVRQEAKVGLSAEEIVFAHEFSSSVLEHPAFKHAFRLGLIDRKRDVNIKLLRSTNGALKIFDDEGDAEIPDLSRYENFKEQMAILHKAIANRKIRKEVFNSLLGSLKTASDIHYDEVIELQKAVEVLQNKFTTSEVKDAQTKSYYD